MQRTLLTSADDLYEDLEWLNEPVVADGNLISSRTPLDLAALAKALVEFLKRT